MSAVDDIIQAYQLTDELAKMVRTLRNVPDDKLRYQQLLFLAAKAKPMDAALKVPENKVAGCLSTVYVHATQADDKVYFVGDSDSQLTKGLVSLLVNGLSGSSIDAILAVQPEFIKYAGITQSLTPGRNSGFLNMLNLMKRKAAELKTSTAPAPAKSPTSSSSDVKRGPIFRAMSAKLAMLRPVKLEIVDESHKHAGHAGVAGSEGGETHFKVNVVAECFSGLSLVQRHKMIYTLLDHEMNNGIHALSVNAKAPAEVA
jgi:sulfur transfer protein SufE/stress-induced morphogen